MIILLTLEQEMCPQDQGKKRTHMATQSQMLLPRADSITFIKSKMMGEGGRTIFGELSHTLMEEEVKVLVDALKSDGSRKVSVNLAPCLGFGKNFRKQERMIT